MKILLIRFSSIGDIILTTPVIRCTKSAYPNAEIHFLTKAAFAPLLESNPYLSKIHTLQGDIQPLLLDLLKEKFDVVIDLHKNLRTAYVKAILRQAFNSNIRMMGFNKLNIRKWIYVNLKWNLLPDKSIVDRYFEGVRKLGIVNDGQGLDFFISTQDELKKEDLPMSHSHGFIVCSIGGQHETKKMPISKWIELCRQISFPLVLVGGKEDHATAKEISSLDPVRIYNACGKFTVNESAQIIKKSRLVITHDTGMMHIAAAFKKPIISIWGSTVPAFGMYPYYGYNNIQSNIAPQSTLIMNKVWCQPCSKIGYKACPKKHFNCMNQINLDSIQSKVSSILGTHP